MLYGTYTSKAHSLPTTYLAFGGFWGCGSQSSSSRACQSLFSRASSWTCRRGAAPPLLALAVVLLRLLSVVVAVVLLRLLPVVVAPVAAILFVLPLSVVEREVAVAVPATVTLLLLLLRLRLMETAAPSAVSAPSCCVSESDAAPRASRHARHGGREDALHTCCSKPATPTASTRVCAARTRAPRDTGKKRRGTWLARTCQFLTDSDQAHRS